MKTSPPHTATTLPAHYRIAHVRSTDGIFQTLEEHLLETGEFSSNFADSIGLPLCGRLLGLIHDLGKYSAAFQKYIRDVTGLNGEPARQVAEKLQGTIDHSTSGAQLLWNAHTSKRLPAALAQILSVVIMSHHSRSGMADFLDLSGKSPFLNRIQKKDAKTYKSEVIANAPAAVLDEINRLIDAPELIDEFKNAIRRINDTTTELIPRQNSFALLTRFLFSCLLDADRLSTANFEDPAKARWRRTGETPDWEATLEKFESRIKTFKQDTEVNRIRAKISDECRDAATRPERILSLRVPTGGGKTFASLRFALHRAASGLTHRVDRIIYVVPYTSILDQNAKEVRQILGEDQVLEHHSNLAKENDTWRNRVLSENWDAPIVFTTSVQFLNALFAAGTKTARRMHQMSNAILIFDEIQALPVKTIHLFNNSLNFLCHQANTTSVLCTATLPLLHKVDSKLGCLPLTDEDEIILDKRSVFRDLKRTEIIDACRPGGWTYAEIADFAKALQIQHGSLLIVCNTKGSAHILLELLRSKTDAPVVHLSTNMCPAHRRHRIDEIRTKLDPLNPQPIICVSTQLIEAGVDLDFGCVIRSLAGLDSIVQAAGRCNRHGHRKTGHVHVLNLQEEKLYASLREIELAQQITQTRIFQEFRENPESLECDLLSEKAMNRYYHYYFYNRSHQMPYPCAAGKGNPPLHQSCTLLSLLSTNCESLSEANRIRNAAEITPLKLRQAHSTAANAFRVIDAPTQGILVPYDQDGHSGSRVIADLAASYTDENVSLADQVRLHKMAQHYTVNAFPHVIERLIKNGVLHEIQPGTGIFHLDERHYHDDLGVTLEALSEQHFLHA